MNIAYGYLALYKCIFIIILFIIISLMFDQTKITWLIYMTSTLPSQWAQENLMTSRGLLQDLFGSIEKFFRGSSNFPLPAGMSCISVYANTCYVTIGY